MPGDLHKLWRARDPKGYHVEYGYSCMGYEIPGGMGVKLAAPEREVFVMIGDGSYLMLPGELPTAVAEGIKLVIVLVQNHGYASIGALSRSVGSAGFGTLYHARANGSVPTDEPAGRAAADRPRGQRRIARRAGDPRAHDRRGALGRWQTAREADGPVVVHVEVDRYEGVPELRELVGRAGGRGRRPTSRCARRARSTSAPGGPSASTWRAP